MRKTKIICTIGPATETKTKINLLLKNGMNVARLNFSHGTHAWFARTINTIRQEAKQLGKPIAIIQDLCGPKIRLGDHPKNGLQIKHGQKIILAYKPGENLMINKNLFSCTIDLSKYLHKGQIILLDDGKAQLETYSVNKKNHYVTFTSQSNHYLTIHKGINLPDIALDIPSLTDKDIKDLIFGIKYQPEYIALSFVKQAKDINRLKKILIKHEIHSQIIAKIETNLALTNIDEIISSADGIMVARGDLGLETPIDQLPLVQKNIIEKCLLAHKTVIVATQMLASMTNNPIPTRAEVTDVANAVFDHTDAVMLSEESAVGDFPIKTVNTMARLCESAEQKVYPANTFIPLPSNEQASAIASSACKLAIDLQAKYIFVPSRTGRTAKIIASFRPSIPIIAFSSHQITINQLNLVWEIQPLQIPSLNLEKSIEFTVNKMIAQKLLKKSDKIIVVIGQNMGFPADELLIKTI